MNINYNDSVGKIIHQREMENKLQPYIQTNYRTFTNNKTTAFAKNTKVKYLTLVHKEKDIVCQYFERDLDNTKTGRRFVKIDISSNNKQDLETTMKELVDCMKKGERRK